MFYNVIPNFATMLHVICFLVFVVVNGVVAQSSCVPDPVDNISLSSNYTLTWSPSLNCNATDYLVYVQEGSVLEYMFEVASPSLDVSTLPACKEFSFIVVAHSQNSVSRVNSIDAVIPMSPDAEFTITFFNVWQEHGNLEIPRSIVLEWDVFNQSRLCVDSYRVDIQDANMQVISSFVTENSLELFDFLPCMEYEFTVRAIYNTTAEGPVAVSFLETWSAVTSLPSLENVTLGDTYVDLTWRLQKYAENKCPIIGLTVDGAQYYMNMFSIDDTPERLPITVRVEPLEPDKMYFFEVRVINNAGTSRSFKMAVNTVPTITNASNNLI